MFRFGIQMPWKIIYFAKYQKHIPVGSAGLFGVSRIRNTGFTHVCESEHNLKKIII